MNMNNNTALKEAHATQRRMWTRLEVDRDKPWSTWTINVRLFSLELYFNILQLLRETIQRNVFR